MIPPEVLEYVSSIMENYPGASHARVMPKIATATELEAYEALRLQRHCRAVDYQEFWWQGKGYVFGFHYI